MTNPESSRPAQVSKSNSRNHLIHSGSVTLKIYECHKKDRQYFTVAWHVGPKRHRQNFKTLEEAKAFAKVEAEKLAAGQVHAHNVTVAQDMKEALRRLGPVQTPIQVVAGE